MIAFNFPVFVQQIRNHTLEVLLRKQNNREEYTSEYDALQIILPMSKVFSTYAASANPVSD